MPTIEFNKNDFFSLLGQEIGDQELDEKLARVKIEVEEIETDRIEVEITSDRIDLLSVEGIVRSLRAYLGQNPGLQKYEAQDSDYIMQVDNVPARPYVVGAIIKDIDLTTPAVKSIIQLQEKLHGTFGRDRERVSIGVHDTRNIEFPLRYIETSPDEHGFIPLQDSQPMTPREILENHDKGKKYAHLLENFDKWPIIVDADDNVLSFPPIINAKRTEVDTTTRNLFIDVTGTDLDSLQHALNVIVTSLAERGGEIHKLYLETPDGNLTTPDFTAEERQLDLGYIQNVIGIDLTPEQAREYLEKMAYGVIQFDDSLEILVPPYRADILHDIDIAEDIAIGYGYNNIEPELPDIATIGSEDPMEQFMHSVRELAVGFGYQELMNPTLTSKHILLEQANRNPGNLVELENPVSMNYSVGRDMLLPQLLETLSKNTHAKYPQKLFEAADIILQDESRPVQTRTDKHLAAVHADKDADYNSLREELEGLLEALEIQAQFKAHQNTMFIPGRCAQIRIDGDAVGVIGELHPQVLDSHGIEMPTAGFELNLAKLRELKG